MKLLVLLSSLLASLFSGCGSQKPFSGGFEFRNATSEALYLTGMTGFRHPMVQAGVGTLISKAALALEPMDFPPESVLSWRDAAGRTQSQTLWTGNSLKPERGKALIVEYTLQRRWTVFFEKVPYL